MHRRNIGREDFEAIAAEMINVERFPGEPEITTGRREDHGLTILVRHGAIFVALVDEPGFLDSGALSLDGSMLVRAMRAGRA